MPRRDHRAGPAGRDQPGGTRPADPRPPVDFPRSSGHARRMNDSKRTTGTPGARAVFTVCLAVIAIGLIIMIALPLAGR